MRALVASILLLAGCDSIPALNKPEPAKKIAPSHLCVASQNMREVFEMRVTNPDEEVTKNAALVGACIWRNAVYLAPAPDDANIVAKAVMHECDLPLLRLTNSTYKMLDPNKVTMSDRLDIARDQREEWEVEALANVVKARAGKCSDPDLATSRTE